MMMMMLKKKNAVSTRTNMDSVWHVQTSITVQGSENPDSMYV